jgi:SAM-dependent methyltransferase
VSTCNPSYTAEGQRQLFPPDAAAVLAIHDRFQRVQAELGLPLELACFHASPQWRRARRVLDVGCGNGAYLHGLAAQFPDKEYVGVDYNPDLVEIARRAPGGPGVEVRHADWHDVTGRFDCVVARLFVQYLPDPEEFVARVAALAPGGSLFVIDADDRQRLFWPPAPGLTAFFEEYRRRQRAVGLDRDRLAALTTGAHDGVAWRLGARQDVVIPSLIEGHRRRFAEAYGFMLDLVEAMRLFAYDFDAVREEWCQWNADPRAYTQIGVSVLRFDLGVTGP